MDHIQNGTSGWTYAGSRDAFYPPKLHHKRELAYASRLSNSIEINGTFYREEAEGCRESDGQLFCFRVLR